MLINNKYRLLKIVISFLLVFLFIPASSVVFNYPSGARQSGMSNAGVTLFDVWSVYHNQAGLAKITGITFGFHYENRYAVDEYAQQSFAIAVPVAGGTIGAAYTFFGYSHYNESKFGLSFGKSFGERLSVGIQLDGFYVQLTDAYYNGWAITFEAGILAEPVDKLFIGAHVTNPAGSKFHRYEEEKLPVIFQLGMSYRFTDNFLLCLESEKSLDTRVIMKSGAEYKIVDNVYIRGGVSTCYMSTYSFGMGFVYKGLRADLAFSDHSVLGFTPHLSLTYAF